MYAGERKRRKIKEKGIEKKIRSRVVDRWACLLFRLIQYSIGLLESHIEFVVYTRAINYSYYHLNG